MKNSILILLVLAPLFSFSNTCVFTLAKKWQGVLQFSYKIDSSSKTYRLSQDDVNNEGHFFDVEANGGDRKFPMASGVLKYGGLLIVSALDPKVLIAKGLDTSPSQLWYPPAHEIKIKLPAEEPENIRIAKAEFLEQFRLDYGLTKAYSDGNQKLILEPQYEYDKRIARAATPQTDFEVLGSGDLIYNSIDRCWLSPQVAQLSLQVTNLFLNCQGSNIDPYFSVLSNTVLRDVQKWQTQDYLNRKKMIDSSELESKYFSLIKALTGKGPNDQKGITTRL